MSFENKMIELRTSIDTKIDESLRGPKTIDQMTAAVETIQKGSSGESADGPIYKLTFDSTNPYFSTALHGEKTVYYANTPGWDCSKINFYKSEYGELMNLTLESSNFVFTNDLPGQTRRDRFKFAEQPVPENDDDWVENWPHFLQTQLSPTFFTRGAFTFTVDIVLNRCIYNTNSHFLYFDNYSAFSLWYNIGNLRFNYVKAPNDRRRGLFRQSLF